MVEVIKIEQVKKGDVLLIDLEDRIEIITVDKIYPDGLMVPVEWGGMDFNFDNPDEIIRIGNKKEKPDFVVLSKSLNLGLSKFWQEKWQKPF